MKQLTIFLILTITLQRSVAQNPFRHFREATETRYSADQPVINYLLKVDTNDLTSFWVETQIKNIADAFQLGMVAHPEYDDRYWRFVKDFTVTSKNGVGKIIRKDSALWHITSSGNEALVKYRIQLPPTGNFRGAWRPFLNSTGILFGGPHSFMYVVGHELAPSHLKLELPANWKISTGLMPTSDPNTFFAPTAFALIDAPILAGVLKSWKFSVDAIPHSVYYYPLPNATLFDETMFVSNIEKLVRQTAALFGRLPYREYVFQIQDGSYGGLEHFNSVTLGAQSSQLSKDMTDFMGELAHEYFHSWNLMRIHPIEYVDVSYHKQQLSKGLWFSEGLTMFYADLLLRRAGLPVEDSSRIVHLETLIRRYYSSPGNHKVSPEKVSVAAYGPQGMLGDYSGSSHLQGELLGTIFDLIIRTATNGRKSMDDVMRRMLEKFSGEPGFTSYDIEQVLKEVSGRDFHQFFEDHVRGNKEIDFNKYLALMGMQMKLSWADVSNAEGKPIPDLRVYAFQNENESVLRFGTRDPNSIWAKAGLHTGDQVRSINDTVVKTDQEFFVMIRKLQIGDKVIVEVVKNATAKKIPVTVSGYQGAVVKLEELPVTNSQQQFLRRNWLETK